MNGDPRHIVAATGVVIAADGRVLLVQTTRAGWEPPGGQMELGEDLVTGLQREILEEAGVRVEVERLVSVSSNVRSGAEKVVFTFVCKPLHLDARARGEAIGSIAPLPTTSSASGPSDCGRNEA